MIIIKETRGLPEALNFFIENCLSQLSASQLKAILNRNTSIQHIVNYDLSTISLPMQTKLRRIFQSQAASASDPVENLDSPSASLANEPCALSGLKKKRSDSSDLRRPVVNSMYL